MITTEVFAINVALHNGKVNKYNSLNFFSREENKKTILENQAEKHKLIIRKFYPKCDMNRIVGMPDAKGVYETDYENIIKLLEEDYAARLDTRREREEDFF